MERDILGVQVDAFLIDAAHPTEICIADRGVVRAVNHMPLVSRDHVEREIMRPLDADRGIVYLEFSFDGHRWQVRQRLPFLD